MLSGLTISCNTRNEMTDEFSITTNNVVVRAMSIESIKGKITLHPRTARCMSALQYHAGCSHGA